MYCNTPIPHPGMTALIVLNPMISHKTGGVLTRTNYPTSVKNQSGVNSESYISVPHVSNCYCVPRSRGRCSLSYPTYSNRQYYLTEPDRYQLQKRLRLLTLCCVASQKQGLCRDVYKPQNFDIEQLRIFVSIERSI